MKDENVHIDQLIARFIAGEATEEEISRLNRWLDESEVNRKYFGDIQFISQKAVASNTIVKVDVNKAWSKVHQQMKPKVTIKQQSAKVVRLGIPVWLRVAAAIVLVSGFTFSLYRFYTSSIIESSQAIALVSQDSVVNSLLKDSSSVFLNRNSKITYSPRYGKKDRKVKLEGEAYFDVKHISEKPFVVEAEGTFIQDIGTSFNIKAFTGDTLVEVYVKSGEVKFFTKGSDGITLVEGETGVYNKNTQQFTKTVTSKMNIVSYANRMFIFQNMRLSEVVQQLSAVYKVNIRINNDNLKDCTITVSFDNEEIDVILNIITETLNLQLTKNSEGYIIDGEGCVNP
ncbi:MAG: FecR family protein [Bacteroidales bacterium]